MNWGYKRSFARCVLLFGAGTVLQFLCGDVNPTWLKHPVSVVLAINYVYLLIVLVAKSDKWQWVKSLTNHQTSVSSLASMLAVTILFGLTGKCGPSTWPFCTLLFYFITVLGLRAIEEIINWRRSPKMAMILHAPTLAGWFTSISKFLSPFLSVIFTCERNVLGEPSG